MATTSVRDRIIAGVGAIVFLISASAFTVYVIIDMFKAKTPDTSKNTQVPCVADPNQREVVLDAPEAYKVEGDVTELKTEDLKVGTGAVAKSDDCLIVKYYGTLAQGGTMFDENYTKPTAFGFNLGRSAVIKGWDQGLIGMKVGGTRRLIIPSNLAYGEQSNGNIPSNSDLVFTVELLRITK